VKHGKAAARDLSVMEVAMRRKRARHAVARTAVTVRIPLDVEDQLRRLMELLDLSTPQLFAAALDALEAQTAESADIGGAAR
jgi:hypothetical protein